VTYDASRRPAAAQHGAQEGQNASSAQISVVAATAAMRFLRGQIPLSNIVLLGLNQAISDRNVVNRIVAASRAGASLASHVTRNEPIAQLVRDPQFDWGHRTTTTTPARVAPRVATAPPARPASSGLLSGWNALVDSASTRAHQLYDQATTEASHLYDQASTAVHQAYDHAVATTQHVVAAATAEVHHVEQQAHDLFQSIANLTASQITALEHQLQTRSAELVAFEQHLAHESAQIAAHVVAQLVVHSPRIAFFLLGHEPRRSQILNALGARREVDAFLDNVIEHSTDGNQVRDAFQLYWGVECVAAGPGIRHWSVDLLRSAHNQLKNIPDRDTRAGVWRTFMVVPTHDAGDRMAFGGGVMSVNLSDAGSTAEGAAATTYVQTYGYSTTVAGDAPAGASQITVAEPGRLAAGSAIVIDNVNRAHFTAVTGSTWTLDQPLQQRVYSGARIVPDDASPDHSVGWFTSSVRHEIAHAVDAGLGDTTKGFTRGLGGWWVGSDFDTWANAMGDPWATNDHTEIPAADRAQIKAGIVAAVTARQASSLLTHLGRDHAIVRYFSKQVPVIVAAEASLKLGDNFFSEPATIFGAAGKRFSVSTWYANFQYCNEQALQERVSNYSLYSPAEFFAEAYTVFYEEAGQPGVTPAQYGRHLRNTAWREWIRVNIDQRGHSPDHVAAGGHAGGARHEASGLSTATVGKSAHNPG